MKRLFAAKVDHPLADPDEVQKVLMELPGQEAGAALDGAAAWFESLTATDGFSPEYRLDILLKLDETVLAHTRRLARDYLVTPRQTRAHEYRLWQINHRYWEALATAYRDLLLRCEADEKVASSIRAQYPLLCARMLNAYGNEIKWQQFRYGPVESDQWADAGTAWLAAFRQQLANVRVNLYATVQATSVEAEYLRILVLHASSPDNLLPVEIEIAERLIAHLLPNFSLTDLAKPDNVYWVDAAKALPPTRLVRLPEITPTLRFFATRPALAALEAIRAQIQTRGALPAEINFGAQYLPRVVLQVIDHLATCWAPKPPMRHHERRRVKSRMTVVGRFENICLHLMGQAGAMGDVTEPAESWIVEDVSQGGIGAHVALAGKDWLKVGSLVLMQPEGGTNWLLGVVRRFHRESEAAGMVGVETLSKNPVGVVADSLGLPTPVVLLEPPQAGIEIRVAMSVAAWEEQKRLRVALDGRAWRLTPAHQEDAGAGHVVGGFRVEAEA